MNLDGAEGMERVRAVDGLGLLEASLREVERTRPEGLTSAEILDLLATSGMSFSEATLRKYVQIGLLPRSVRVGQKGKHLGSKGLYPTEVVRRIALIKALMAERYTIEDIKQRLLFLSVDIDKLEASLRAILAKIRDGSSSVESGSAKVAVLHQKRADVRAIERLGRELMERLRKLDRDQTQHGTSDDRGFGADGTLRRAVQAG
jgi:DNA-binding transcriptional MerR regulator